MNPQTVFSLGQETQFVVFGIVFVGTLLLGLTNEGTWRPFFWTLGWLGVNWLLSVFVDVPLEQSHFFIRRTWRTVSPENAIWLMLSLDLGFVAFLVKRTGGSERSCFSPLYFMLPTFALLLLGYSTFLLLYCIVAVGAFGFTLLGNGAQKFFKPYGWDVEKPKLVIASRIALVTISTACLFLAIYIDVYKPREQGGSDRTVKSQPKENSAGGAEKLNVSPIAQANPTPQPVFEKPVITLKPDAYTEFLGRFQKPGLKPADLDKILKRNVGKRKTWDVKFEDYKLARQEIIVFFSPVDTTVSLRTRPVRLGKFGLKQRQVIENLKRGVIIRITGRLERHSAEQLYLAGSTLDPW